MELQFDPDNAQLTLPQTYFPPALLQEGGPVLREYYDRIVEGLRLAVTHQADEEKRAILEALEKIEW